MGKIVICETTLDYFDGIDSNIINPDEDIIIFNKYQFVVYNSKIILGTQVLFLPSFDIGKFYKLDEKYPYRCNKFLNPWINFNRDDYVGFMNFNFDFRTPLWFQQMLIRPYHNNNAELYYPEMNYYLVKVGFEFKEIVE